MSLTFWQDTKRQVRWERIALYLAFLAFYLWLLHRLFHKSLAAWGHWKKFLVAFVLFWLLEWLLEVAVVKIARRKPPFDPNEASTGV